MKQFPLPENPYISPSNIFILEKLPQMVLVFQLADYTRTVLENILQH